MKRYDFQRREDEIGDERVERGTGEIA